MGDGTQASTSGEEGRQWGRQEQCRPLGGQGMEPRVLRPWGQALWIRAADACGLPRQPLRMEGLEVTGLCLSRSPGHRCVTQGLLWAAGPGGSVSPHLRAHWAFPGPREETVQPPPHPSDTSEWPLSSSQPEGLHRGRGHVSWVVASSWWPMVMAESGQSQHVCSGFPGRFWCPGRSPCVQRSDVWPLLPVCRGHLVPLVLGQDLTCPGHWHGHPRWL